MGQGKNHSETGNARHSRAAAFAGGKKAAVSYPAKMPGAMQRYSEDHFFGRDFRFSEDIRMGVEKNNAKLFLAEHGVETGGGKALVEIYRDDEDRIFKVGIDYVNQCGEYAGLLMREMAGFRRGAMQVTNANVKEGVTNFTNTFDDIELTGTAAPGVGEAFYVFNNPKDDLFGVKDGHFNFHWGAVVAKSGDDVVTAEADSNASDMWFQMYNTSIFGQSFKDHWFTKGKLHKTAKEFQVRFQKRSNN